MREHIRILGILNIIMGCLTALGGVLVLLIMGGVTKIILMQPRYSSGLSDQDAAVAAPIIATIGLAIGIFLIALAAPAIIGGLGLLNFRPWSRILMIIVSIFHLIHVPLGTALGVYGLWVLFSDESKRLLESGGHLLQPVPGSYPLPGAPPQAIYPPSPPPPAL